MRVALLALALVLTIANPLRAASPQDGGVEFFEKKVRPILVQHCYSCHSAESKKIKGGLRLTSRANIIKGGESGPAAVSGDPRKRTAAGAIGRPRVSRRRSIRPAATSVSVAWSAPMQAHDRYTRFSARRATSSVRSKHLRN